MLEFYFRFRFHPWVVTGMSFCIGLSNFTQIVCLRQSYDVVAIFKMAAVGHAESHQE